MAIPNFQNFMRPVLSQYKTGASTLDEMLPRIQLELNLTDNEMQMLVPSGTMTIVKNRASWAKTYLYKAGLIDKIGQGKYAINSKGKLVLDDNPNEITNKVLNKFDSFKQFNNKIETDPAFENGDIKSLEYESSPDEKIQSGLNEINSFVKGEFIDEIFRIEPMQKRAKFFEHLVLDLILAMGYGSGNEEAGKVIGGSGDEGLDCVINLDKLGIDKIYLQAKCYKRDNKVPPKDIDAFLGSFNRKQAKGGIFITTSSFSNQGKGYEKEANLVLIDGERLADLCFQYNIGFQTKRTIEIKKIDSDYFNDE